MLIGKILLKQAFRYFQKNKLFSIVNILGLSISVALIALLSVFISTESNVDRFHKNESRIYRVVRANECAFSPPFGQYIVDNIDGAETFCRTFVLGATLKSDNNLLKSPNCYYVDSNFFEMFSFPLIKGESKSVLVAQNSIVLSESYAKRLFPNTDPVGKAIRFNNRLDYIVSGIASDFKENTHFKQADVIFPFVALADYFNQVYLEQYDWKSFMPSLYVMAREGSDLSAKGEELYNKVKPWYWLFQEDESKDIEFQPLRTIYFHPATYGFPTGAREGNQQLLKFITLIVLGILFITIINFVNLTVSYSLKRRNEIGIKKIIGAQKQQIVLQSLLETALLFTFSIIVSLFLIASALPVFNQLTGYQVETIQLFTEIKWHNFLFVYSIFYAVTGIIPAFIISGYSPLSIVQKTLKSIKLNYVQQSLVVLQVSISTFLIVTMLTILKQNHFLKNFDIGFNKEETLYIELNSEIKNKKLAFKDELKKIAGVEKVSLCNGMPGVGIPCLRFEANNVTQSLDYLNVDEDYFRVLDVKLQNKVLPDKNSCWINESAAQSLGFRPSDKTIEIEEYGIKRSYLVNEVLPDMNFHPLYQKTNPAIFTKLNTTGWVDYVLLRINTSNTKNVLADAKRIHKKFSPNFSFHFAFLKDELNKAYEKEIRTSKIVTWFSLFAIIISSLGIFTLAVFSCNIRIKEIGIRKVNGARISEVLIMLNRDFVKWVAIAFVIATPIAWYAMNKWLQNFAYRTELSWWIFAMAGLLALGIALLTVSFQSWHAASRNPVDALRYE
jgi:putative ABC transport system permease protein